MPCMTPFSVFHVVKLILFSVLNNQRMENSRVQGNPDKTNTTTATCFARPQFSQHLLLSALPCTQRRCVPRSSVTTVSLYSSHQAFHSFFSPGRNGFGAHSGKELSV